jgi:hypothetical protein
MWFFGNQGFLIRDKALDVLICRIKEESLMVCILLVIVLLLWVNWIRREKKGQVYDFII